MKKTGFHFGVPIEICDRTYYIDLNREGVQEKIEPLGAKIKEALEESKKRDDVTPVAAATKEFIDTFLGAGAFDEIFAGRIVTNFDMAALHNYIAAEAIKNTKRMRADLEKRAAAVLKQEEQPGE